MAATVLTELLSRRRSCERMRRRPLAAGGVTIVQPTVPTPDSPRDQWAAAAELQLVGLAEALTLTLPLADGEPSKYERATPVGTSPSFEEAKKVLATNAA
jgi:hypothetical protein